MGITGGEKVNGSVYMGDRVSGFGFRVAGSG